MDRRLPPCLIDLRPGPPLQFKNEESPAEKMEKWLIVIAWLAVFIGLGFLISYTPEDTHVPAELPGLRRHLPPAAR